jgi:hypothetical protein
MIAEQFEEANVVLGEGQPEYTPLPAYYNKREQSMTFCFSLNKEEIEEITKTGKIWFSQLTHNRPFQPIALSTQKSDLIR